MTEDTEKPYAPEETVVDELLAGRGDPNEILRPTGGTESERKARRESLETLGLLAYGVEGKQPSSDLKARVLAGVAEASRLSQSRSVIAEEAPGASALPEIGQRTVVTPHSSDEPMPDRFGSASSYPRWLLPLAATMAFVALGVAGWQAVRVAELRAIVGRQTEELVLARESASRLEDARTELQQANSKVALLTAPGSEVCALKPGRDSSMQRATGALVMNEAAERWLMKVAGLDPSREGFQYQLWYLTDEGPVPAAAFSFDSPGASVEMLTERSLVEVRALMITLEPVGSQAPSSAALLYGDERMRIL